MAFNFLMFVAVITLTATITSCDSGDDGYDTRDMWRLCSRYPSTYTYSATSINEYRSVLVYSHNISRSHSQPSCSVVFKADDSSDNRLYVKAEALSLGSSKICLKLWDGNFDRSMELNSTDHQHCGDAPFDLDLTTSQRYLTITITNSEFPFDFDNVAFRLVITTLTTACASLSKCDNGDCIWSTFRNDGHQNCPDNSDEKGITTAPCVNQLPSCKASGKCIAFSSKCDRFVDCPDGSDELNCLYDCITGDYGDYQCQNGVGCYSKYDRCDERRECSDGSDNMNCDSCTRSYHGDSEEHRYCAETRTCLVDDQLCNGVVDCPNGMDEEYEPCHPSIYWYWTPGQLAGLFVGFVVFSVVVLGIAGLVHKKCQAKRVE